jgi:hypothetical protein
MMTPLRFEHIAHQAIPSSFVFVVTKVKTPENGHLTWVSHHGLQQAPYQHEKECMKNH